MAWQVGEIVLPKLQHVWSDVLIGDLVQHKGTIGKVVLASSEGGLPLSVAGRISIAADAPAAIGSVEILHLATIGHAGQDPTQVTA